MSTKEKYRRDIKCLVFVFIISSCKCLLTFFSCHSVRYILEFYILWLQFQVHGEMSNRLILVIRKVQSLQIMMMWHQIPALLKYDEVKKEKNNNYVIQSTDERREK